MKYKDPVTGEWKELYTKTADTLPVGSIVDFEGEEVPAGWEEINDKYSYIVSTVVENTHLNGNTDIPLVLSHSKGSKFSIENGKIKIGAGVSKVRISGSIFTDISYIENAGYMWGRIAHNNSNTLGSITPIVPNMSFASASIPSTIINVKEGDLLHLNADATGLIGVARSGANNTWLCVEVIE